jgi:diaminopimelate epimerase
MEIPFTKMHGLGNDFMLVRWPAGRAVPTPERVRAWASRRHGVGFDQLLLVSEAEPGEADAAYRIFNADGGEVEQCGNGARCIARFLATEPGTTLRLASAGGLIQAELLDGERVRVSYGVPDFAPESLPFETDEERDRYRLELAQESVEFGAVSLGNPHAVIEVDSVDDAPVGILGAELATHPAFPRGVNVGFMQVQSDTSARLRVYERGVGETQACGTGAAAAAAVGRRWGVLAEEVDMGLPGGTLTMHWAGPGAPLWQIGPTSTVFEGRIEL